MSGDIVKHSSYVSGPRWAGIRSFLYDVADSTDCWLTQIQVDKGWITECVYFTVNGEQRDVNNFLGSVRANVAKYDL